MGYKRNLKNFMENKKSIEIVLKETNTNWTLIKIFRRRQLQFIGYLKLCKSLDHLLLLGK